MKIIRGLAKIILSGLVAIVVLSFILCFYSLMPVHIENENGNTDFVWEENSHWVKMTEGISWGKFDGNGYNNSSVINNPDIIVLGSSHMEATEVMQDENASYLLNEKLSGKYNVYNMGISSHTFYKVCQYMPKSIELFEETPKVVIVETSTVNITNKNVTEILQGSVAYKPSKSTGVIGNLQKVPFLRLLYKQIDGGLLKLFMPNNNSIKSSNEDTSIKAEVDEGAYEKLFGYLSSLENKYGTKIIIVYHPTETINEDGTVSFNNDENLNTFKIVAERNRIDFIDMTAQFEKMYMESHHVPHGFVTGKLATGHLNKYGHAAVAEALYKEIKELDEEGNLCK